MQTPITIGIIELNWDVLDLLLILHNIVNTQDCLRIPNLIILILLQLVNVTVPAIAFIKLKITVEVNRVDISFISAFGDAAAILQKAAAAKLKIVATTAAAAIVKAAFIAGIAFGRFVVAHGKGDTICSSMIASLACPCC